MSDREILHAYYPDSVGDETPVKSLTYKEIFWQIGKGRGLTEGQIIKEWAKNGGR
jgi:hypothetical protein